MFSETDLTGDVRNTSPFGVAAKYEQSERYDGSKSRLDSSVGSISSRLEDGVHFRASMDEDGICRNVGDAEKRHEEGGLVAANAVAVVERDVHIVRFVAWRIGLQREAHVSDLLRDELEKGADFRIARGAILCKVVHQIRHRWSCGGKMRLAHSPVPAGDGGPIRRR